MATKLIVKAPKTVAPLKARKPVSRVRSVAERAMTLDERLEDMRAHGKEVRKTKASAVEFLKRAGIFDASGKLAEPFRN